jgi:long-chain acyl-CoA synthetase
MASLGFWNFAQKDPSVLALAAPDGKEWTRGELFALQNQIAHGLRAAGLKKGDAVAVAMPNSAEFVAIYLACAQSGWYLVPINWHLAASEIAYIVQDCEAKAFIAHERVGDVCRAAADEIAFPASQRFAMGAIPGFRAFGDLIQSQPTTLPPDRAAGAVMNYTSGTTGKPKGVRRPLAPLDPDTVATLFTGFLAMFGIQPEAGNVHFIGSPLYHTAVLVFGSASMNMGHPVVLVEKWSPEDCLRLIEKYRVTTSHMVPTQFHRMLGLAPDVRAKYDCSSTRTMVHAAAPCPPDVKRRMLDWWGDSIYEYYAATEGGGTIVTPQEWRRFPGTVGKPWPGAEIKIFDDEGKEMATPQQGTVYIRLGQQGDFEYHKDKEKTRKNRLGNYFTVGDVGYLNEEGYLFLCDRKIDMIISGGANIYPAEIENVLLTHPKIGDVAVFGIPNEDWGEEVKAVIEPAAGVTPGPELAAEILAFCADKLAKFKTPKTIDFLAELPRDPNGKLYKRKLRDPYWANRERAI